MPRLRWRRSPTPLPPPAQLPPRDDAAEPRVASNAIGGAAARKQSPFDVDKKLLVYSPVVDASGISQSSHKEDKRAVQVGESSERGAKKHRKDKLLVLNILQNKQVI